MRSAGQRARGKGAVQRRAARRTSWSAPGCSWPPSASATGCLPLPSSPASGRACSSWPGGSLPVPSAVRVGPISSRRSGSGASPVGAGVASSAHIALCFDCVRSNPFGQPLLEATAAAARKASLLRSTPFGNRRRFHIAFVHCLPTVCYSTHDRGPAPVSSAPRKRPHVYGRGMRGRCL